MTNRLSQIILKLFILSILLLVSSVSFAQSIYSIKLHLLDEKTQQPVAFATTSVTMKGDRSPLKYTLTDENGYAVLAGLKRGSYIFRAELMGYKAYEKEVVLEKNMDLGTIRMTEDAEVIDAAKISAIGNPIVVKKDTIEYTASSFKTSDNDMLEELLKKLPGVEVEADGSITANGETIKKITIDGKTFFLDDPQLASKNIPAKLVEKVKVVEKKSDQAMFTGIDDGEEETVIDLSLRPGMRQGWFGNIMAGGGHDVPGTDSSISDPRYQGAAMVGRFTDDNQISLILNGNNTNNRGFNDMSGSMMQGMRGGGMGRGMGGWGRSNGVTTSWMGGLNGAFTFLDGDMDLAGNYLYNGTDNFVDEETSKITYLDDGRSLHNNQTGVGNTITQGHRMGVRLEHEFTENTSILFEPQFNFGRGSYREHSDFQTYNEFDEVMSLTNEGKTLNTGDNSNWSTSGFFLFRHRLGKPGRTISANFRYSFSNNDMTGFNQSVTRVVEEIAEQPTDPIVNQYFDMESSSASLSGRVVYTEPLIHDLFLEANYEYRWNRNQSYKNTYNSGSNVIDPQSGLPIYLEFGSKLDERYSNMILNRAVTQKAGVSLSYQKEKFRAQIGASAIPTDTYNETTGHKSYNSEVVNWSPQASLNYEFNDNSHIRFFYYGYSSQPSTSQLMPVPDNSNPLVITLGNPNLDPYFSHNIRGMFGYTNKKTFTSVNARFAARLIENAITNANWYDDAGVQYSIPVNGPQTASADMRVMVNSPFGNSGLSIFSMTFARYGQSTSYVGKSNLNSDLYYDKESASFKYGDFNRDYPDLSESADFISNHIQTMNFTQRLRLTYRNDFVELTLGGRTRMNKSWYTMKNSELQPMWSNQAEFSMNWTVPGGINLIADLDYNWYNGFTTPQEDEYVLNAEVTKLLFKNKFTLALKAYDILGQSKNLSISDSANYHQEVRNNTLGRYIILSLTYRFGNFGGGRGHGPGGPPHNR